MRLAKLTLSGFKSFADRTEFTFDEAITGIVGPNGCGKSNIVDSIKWVLGERSSKSLRGKEMIDVIFAGSAGRKPSGLASVMLSFENPVIDESAEMVELQYGDNAEADDQRRDGGAAAPEADSTNPPTPELSAPASEPDNPTQDPGLSTPDSGFRTQDPGLSTQDSALPSRRRRALPIDADVVEVERRLYRDGTSQYLINGRRARLKDIRDLFLDTGIGADAYSIIEQGKVDAMLLASPQERRTIFEEAAGIAKYKQRRIEAQRKLERAQANLTLTREQLQNTERRLRMVKGQAAKARRFKELDAELRAYRMALAFDQYDDMRQRLEGLTSRIAELEGVRTESQALLSEIESRKQEFEISRHELLKRHKDAEEQRLAARHAEQQASQRMALTERAIQDARRQAEADDARLAEIESRIAELAAAGEEQRSLIAAASERLAEAERLLESASSERAGILELTAERQASLAEKRAAASNIERERMGLMASIQADERREESIREQARKIDERRAALSGEITRVQGQHASLGESAEGRRARIAGFERDLAARDSAAAELSAGRREVAGKVAALEHQFLRLDGRRTTLQEMDAARVGLGDAAKDVLARRDAGQGFAGVIAPLADLIETDTAHASAAEAALGANLQALVIGSIAAMPTADEIASLTGRVTFVPMTGLESRGDAATPAHRWNDEAVDPALVASGRVTPLAGVVRLRDQGAGSGLLHRLLARTYLVENLDAALMLAAAAPGARFVTRDGAVMEPDGRITAGPAGAQGEAGGMLQRRSELAELRVELERLESALESERQSLRSVDAEAAAISAQQADLRQQLAADQRALVGEQTRLEQLASELARFAREGGNLDDESRQLSTRLAKLEEDRARLRDRAEKLLGLHGELAAAAADIEQELKSIALRAEAANEQMTALRVEASKLGEQLGAARREDRRIELAAEAAEREKRDLSRLVQQSRERLAEHERTIAEAAGQIERSSALAVELEAAVADIAQQVDAAAATAEELGGQVSAARAHAQHVERDWHSLEVARRELEVKRENLEERTQQELELDLGWEYVEYRRMIDDGGVARLDQSAAAAQVADLRDQVKKLGSVNLESIEEETQLESRNEELIRQVADIDDAARKLTDLIERLNIASKERFGEVFSKIQGNFAGSDGMFRKLFGGGKAEVRLMPLVKEVETPEGVKRVETDETDLLESGIEVIAKPPGKEPRSISQLSGGEKTLTAVALLLAIFQSKPSCFCILDEVDAALDEGNVGRYCNVVREFTTHSHFIVITHNKKTMQAADRLYGITMQERGVSTRVTVKFEQVGKDGAIRLNGKADPAPAMPEVAPVTETPRDEEPLPEPKPRRNLLRRALAGMRESDLDSSRPG